MSENTPQKKVAADGHEYHLSANANASTAPTNEITIANATKSASLTNDELEFVSIIHYEWGLHGQVNCDTLIHEYGFSSDSVDSYLKSSHVVEALEERGIPKRHLVPKVEDDSKSPAPVGKLTPIQLIAANALLDLTDNRSDKKKLTDLGVTTATYQMWLRDADFSGYLRERAESLIGDNQHEALLSLLDNVRAGRTDAIKLYLEMTGRFVSQAQTQQGSAPQHDLQQLVVRIVEIIVEEVDDPQIAARISDRLKGLVMGNQVAGVLTAPNEVVIHEPEVAAARELTPGVKDLMEKGIVGYND